jgi:hypothetical protein
MEYPLAVVADSQGTLFVADRNVPAVWKIQLGKLSMLFQASKKFRTPLNAVRCLALDRQGRLLAGDSATREVYRFDAAGKPEPLAQGVIGIPMALAVGSTGDIFAADLEAHAIYQIPAAGGKPIVFASVPAPRGLAVDTQDRLWVVSHGKDHVVRIGKDKKSETIVAGQPFNFAHQIVLDAGDNAYVADGYEKTIWKVPAGGKPEKLFSGEPLKNPVGLCLQGNTLLIVDPHTRTIFSGPTAGGALSAVPAAP